MFWTCRRRNKFVSFLGAVLAIAVSSTTLARDFQGIPVKGEGGSESASDWVVHEPSGRVFCSIANGQEVVEYATKGELRRFKVGDQPDEMVIKGDLLIVGCSGSTSLYALNLKTNQVAGVAKLNGKGPYSLFCSKASDPYVYCICNTGDAWWDGSVFQVDTTTMKVRKTASVQRWGQSHPVHVAMSPDGKWIVPDARGRSSPSGADLMKVNHQDLEFLQIRDYHSSFGQMIAGPMNRYWTFGGDLYTQDITKKIRSFAGSVCAIHPKFDLVASLGANGLVVLQRLSDAREIGRAVTDFGKTRSPDSVRAKFRNNFDPTIQFDLKNDLVFVGMPDGGDWIDLAEYRSELNPLRIVVAPSEHTTLVDKPMRIPVSMTNANASPTASLVVSDGPAGAKIEDGNLCWLPRAEDLGVNYFDLTVQTADGLELDSTRLMVEVSLPRVQLEFSVKSVKLSPNGQTVVAWGAGQGQESRHPAHAGPDALAVIDTRSGKVVAEKDVPQGIRDLAIDDEYVFIAPASGNVLYRFSHQLDASKRLFLQEPPKTIEKISPNVLAVQGQRLSLIDSQSLKATKPPSTQTQAMNRTHPISGSAQFGTSKIANLFGRVTNRKTGELLRIAVSRLPTLSTGSANRNPGIPPRQSPGMKAWGRTLAANGALSNYRGSQIAQPSNVQMSIVSEEYPVGILVATVNEGRTQKTILSFCDLIDGTILQSSVIEEGQPGQRHQNYYGTRSRLIADGRNLIIASERAILFAEIPESIAKSASVPTHFSEKQKIVIPVGKTESFPLVVGGPKEGVTFTLMLEYDGLSLDETTGMMEVETTRLWDNLGKQAGNMTPSNSRSSNSASAFDQETNAALYHDLLGKELPDEMFAARLPVNASLQDSEGQEDAIVFDVLVVGPIQPIEKEVQRVKAEREKAQEDYRKRQAEQQMAREAAMQAAKGNKPVSDDALEQRLEKMESRIRRIEAALDAVLKKLED